MIYRTSLLAGLLVLVLAAATGQAATELTDGQLDEITAGSASVAEEDGMLKFDFITGRRNGRSVDGNGTLTLKYGSVPSTLGTLILSDSAQSNLRSLVNINAVNSPVQVLLNLNINVNSTIGSMRQLNLSGPLR
jgi:hypothetical protein